MSKNTDSSIKLLVLYDILLKSTDEEHALSTNEIIEELKKRGISVSRKVLPSDIDLLNKYGYEICSYVKKSRYYYAVHQFFDTAEITMLADVIKASKLTQSRKETIINKLYSTIGLYRDTATDNIIFLDAKKFGNSSIIYNIDAIETAIKQKKKVSFVYFHLDENKNKVYHNESLELYTERTKDDGTVEQKVEFTIPAPFMYDANGESSDDVYYELEPSENGNYAFAVVARDEWINAAERAFPVTIDPQIVADNSGLVTKQVQYRVISTGSSSSVGNWTNTSSSDIKVYKSSNFAYAYENNVHE